MENHNIMFFQTISKTSTIRPGSCVLRKHKPRHREIGGVFIWSITHDHQRSAFPAR